ncbi:DUF5316 domain-containing protein [Bacillus sp. T33-2]|uniref:DUF5316 domain-containing protein n=1 Tax=Bacillus sp. T33-2 TaxID=2054168 RepID=UPI000C7828B7|nr:hypothetical protein CVD19_15845 [Bacillus sp. T33-2]
MIIRGDSSDIFKISGAIGLASVLLSGFFIGAFLNGDKMRENFYSETNEDRSRRIRNGAKLLFFALPNLAAAIINFFITRT